MNNCFGCGEELVTADSGVLKGGELFCRECHKKNIYCSKCEWALVEEINDYYCSVCGKPYCQNCHFEDCQEVYSCSGDYVCETCLTEEDKKKIKRREIKKNKRMREEEKKEAERKRRKLEGLPRQCLSCPAEIPEEEPEWKTRCKKCYINWKKSGSKK